MENDTKIAFFGRLASSSVRIMSGVTTSSTIYSVANSSEITFTGGGLDKCLTHMYIGVGVPYVHGIILPPH